MRGPSCTVHYRSAVSGKIRLLEDALGGAPGSLRDGLQHPCGLAFLDSQDGELRVAFSPNDDPVPRYVRLLEALGTVRELKLRLLGAGVIQTVAGLAVASGEVALGASLDGAAEMLFQAMGVARDPLNEQTRASIVVHARRVLGEEAFAQASAAGAALGYEAALEEARVWLEARATPATSV